MPTRGTRALVVVLSWAVGAQPVLARSSAGPGELVRPDAVDPVPVAIDPASADASDTPPSSESIGAQREEIADRLVALGRPADEARAAAGDLSAEDLEVLVAHPAMMQAAGGGRDRMARDLVALDYPPDVARETAACLTAADLEVLLAHPEMMQAAGALRRTTEAYIIGGLIVAGIVVLAASGSGFVVTN